MQGIIRTIRSGIEERQGVNINATQPLWPWIGEHARFLVTRVKVVSDGKTAHSRLKGKSAKVHGKMFGEEILRNRKSSHGKLTCMCEDGVCGDFIVGD